MTVEELKVLITAETAELQKQVKNVQSQLKGLDKQSTKTANKMTGAFKKMAKAFSIAAIVTGFAKLTKSAVNAASELEEIQNVVDVAFGGAAQEVNDFAKTCIDRFGLSEAAAKRMASTFMAIGSSMGIANSSAKTMSIQLTGLASDMASFYNASVDAVSSALEGIYTGQTRALRQYGIVIDDATIAEYALSKGITKSVSSMSAAEKATLRYNVVLQQTANAQNDFARTAGSWANQLRVLKNQWNELMTIMGSMAISVLNPVIKALNTILSYLIAIAKAFKAVFFGGSSFAKAAAGAAKGVASMASSTKSASVSAGGVATGFNEATKQATKLKKTIAGFDELEILNSKEEDGGSGIGDIGGGGFNVDSYFDPTDFEMPDLTEFQSDVEGVLRTLKDFVEFVLGPISAAAKALYNYIYPADENGNRTWDWKKIFNVAVLGTVVGSIISWIGKQLPKYFGDLWKYVTNSLGKKGLAGVVEFIGEVVEDVVNGLWDFAKALAGVFNNPIAAMKKLGGYIVKFLQKPFKAVGGVLKTFKYLIKGAFDAVKTFFTSLNPVGAALAALAAGFIWCYTTSEDFRNKITELWNVAVKPFVDGLIEAVKNLWNNHLKPLWESLKAFFQSVWDLIKTLAGILLGIWNDLLAPLFAWIATILGDTLVIVVSWIGTVIANITIFIADVLKWITDFFTNFVNFTNEFIGTITAALAAIGSWIKEALATLIAYILGIFAHLKDFLLAFGEWLAMTWILNWLSAKDYIVGVFTALWNNLKEIWNGIKEIFKGIITFITGVFTGDWKKAWEGVKGIFKGVWDTFIGIAKVPINLVIGLINGLLTGVENAAKGLVNAFNRISFSFSIPDWVPFVGGKSWSFGLHLQSPTLPRLNYLAKGGVLTEPTLAMMGEYAGAQTNPEIVTPENLLRQIVMEGNDDLADTFISVGRQIVAAIQENGTEIRIGDDVISAAAARGDRDFKKRTGRSQFAI